MAGYSLHIASNIYELNVGLWLYIPYPTYVQKKNCNINTTA